MSNAHLHPIFQRALVPWTPRAAAVPMEAANEPKKADGPNFYRIEVEYPGGGVARTLWFSSRASATSWGKHRALRHAGSTLTVEQRPVPHECEHDDDLFDAGGISFWHCKHCQRDEPDAQGVCA